MQKSLIQVVEIITNFTDSVYVEGDWPITFLLELMFFMFDTIICGPSMGAGADAKRNLDAAVPGGDFIFTARLFEQLSLALKDPSGEKKMTIRDFYNDHTCVEEIHEGFVRLYLHSTEHETLMPDLHVDFANRRRDDKVICGGDWDRTHAYLSLCTVAEKWRAKEFAIRALKPPAKRKESAATSELQQRVASIDDTHALTTGKRSSRASLP